MIGGGASCVATAHPPSPLAPPSPHSQWYQYDPTKWTIRLFEKLGLAYDLNRFPDNEIVKGKLQMKQRALDSKKERLWWGPDPSTLPTLTKAEVAARVAGGAAWVVLDGFVVDVAEFVKTHPGGPALLSTEYGNDITAKFKGEVYAHSNAARNLACTMVRGGGRGGGGRCCPGCVAAPASPPSPLLPQRVARVTGYWN